jgi:hypothetical protein
MDILTDSEVAELTRRSKLVTKYNQQIDSESAHEILNKKIALAEQRAQEIEQMETQAKASAKEQKAAPQKAEKSWMDSPAARQVSRTAATILTRSLLGVLGLGGSTTRRKKRTSWF